MTKNDKILVILLCTISDKSAKYIKEDFVVFGSKEAGYIKKAVTYFEKIIAHYGTFTILESDIRTSKYRLERQILKLDTASKQLDLPEEDFRYIALMDLVTILFDEVIENQKLDAEVKTNLKTGNTYLKKFIAYIQNEVGE